MLNISKPLRKCKLPNECKFNSYRYFLQRALTCELTKYSCNYVDYNLLCDVKGNRFTTDTVVATFPETFNVESFFVGYQRDPVYLSTR